MDDISNYLKSKMTFKNLCTTTFMGVGVLGATKVLKTDTSKSSNLKNTVKSLAIVGAGIMSGATVHDFIANYGWYAKHTHGGVVKTKVEAEESDI